MFKELTWNHPEEISSELQKRHPDLDPLDVNFPALISYVTSLDNFIDDPATVSDTHLATIHSAWHRKYTDQESKT